MPVLAKVFRNVTSRISEQPQIDEVIVITAARFSVNSSESFKKTSELIIYNKTVHATLLLFLFTFLAGK